MTRTARAAYPRAVIKDRSESRTGLDSSIRKSGAGHHNWGSIADELRHPELSIDDGDTDTETHDAASSVFSDSSTENNKPVDTEEDLEKARKFRMNAFKGADIDLTAIARTSSAVLTLSPVSPSAVRDGHDNKQIPIYTV